MIAPQISSKEIIWIAIFSITPFAFSSQVYEGAILPKLLVLQILLLPLYLFGLKQSTSPPWLLTLALGFYFSLNTLSIVQAQNPLESVLHLAHHASFIFVPLLVVKTLNIEQLDRILKGAAWVGLPIALIGLSQYLGIAFSSIPSNANPSATFYHRNAAAAYIICTLPLATLGLLNAKTKNHVICWALLITVQGAFLVSTRTRGAWVAIVISGIAVLVISKLISQPNTKGTQFRKTVLAGTCCLIVISTFLPENIQGTRQRGFDEKKSDAVTALTSIVTDQGHRGRLELWKNTLKMIRAHPLGVGLGNWQFWYPHYAQGEHINVQAAPERPHNDLLWIAAELGIIGLLAFCLVLIITGRALYQILKKHSGHYHTALALMAIILAYLIEGLFSFPRAQIMPTLFFWFAVGGLALLPMPILSNQIPHTADYSKWLFLFAIPILILSIQITIQRIQYDVHHLKVHTAERSENWGTVIKEANLAYQYGTLRANTRIAHGRALYRTGDFQNAQKSYAKALTLHPYSLNAYNNLGIVYRRLKEPGKAISAFQNALYLFPNFTEAHFNMGLAYIDQKRWDDAFDAFKQAEDLGLRNSHLYFFIGQIHHTRNNLLQAQNYYLKALEIQPNFEPAQRGLSNLKKQ
ncbi:MAG: O-antigen ligase [Candidatus Latescibacterota bacterium]|jgi:O-antigen ligase